MKMTVEGQVMKVEVRAYTDSQGQAQTAWDAWLSPEDVTRAADRISGPTELGIPKVGDVIRCDVRAWAKRSQNGAFVNIWAQDLSTVADAYGVASAA